MMAHYLDGHYDSAQVPVEGSSALGLYNTEGPIIAPTASYPINASMAPPMRSGSLQMSSSAPAGYGMETYHPDLPVRPQSAHEPRNYTQYDTTASATMVQSESAHSFLSHYQQQSMAHYDMTGQQAYIPPATISPKKIHSSSPPMPYTHDPEDFTTAEMDQMNAMRDADYDTGSEVSPSVSP